jgi:phosphoadenosine phosphosulfate reductase
MLTMTQENITKTNSGAWQFSTLSPFNKQCDFQSINQHFMEKSLEELLKWSFSTFGDTVVQVTSFGPTGMVLLDHLARLKPGVRVITLDTGLLFPETYDLMEAVQRRFAINLDVRRPPLTPAEQTTRHGELWTSNPDHCCYLRKVLPLQEALQGVNAWFSGLRRDQSMTRAHLHLVAWDNSYDIVKINPLADWSRAQVWKYLTERNLPYNALHNQGYTSIGCTPCTRPAANPSDERSGRWPGLDKTECGLHLPHTFINGAGI